MAPPPVRLLRPSWLKIDADAPCVLEMHIPMALPHRLDPSVPAPPYHPGMVTADDLVRLHVTPVLRRVMAAIVSCLFGPQHASAALAAPTWTASAPGAPRRRFLVEYDVSAIVDRENGFDLVAGYWKDDQGVEGHGPIDCYEEEPEGDLLILHAFMVSLVCGVRDAKQLVEMNLRVLGFDFVGGEEGGAPGHRDTNLCLRSRSTPRPSGDSLLTPP